MAIPDKFRNLANAVRNEIYGRDVRESIAKSIEETGASSETAIKITEQLLDESFDEGVLTTEIERRLNELEGQYAPRLSGVEREIEQIGTTVIQREAGLATQITTPTATINFTRDDENSVVRSEEVKDDKTIVTTYVRDDNGIIQQIDREVE